MKQKPPAQPSTSRHAPPPSANIPPSVFSLPKLQDGFALWSHRRLSFLFSQRFLAISNFVTTARPTIQASTSALLGLPFFYASFRWVVNVPSVAIRRPVVASSGLTDRSQRRRPCSSPDRIGTVWLIGWTMGTLVSALGSILACQLGTRPHRRHHRSSTFGGILAEGFLLHLIVTTVDPPATGRRCLCESRTPKRPPPSTRQP